MVYTPLLLVIGIAFFHRVKIQMNHTAAAAAAATEQIRQQLEIVKIKEQELQWKNKIEMIFSLIL